MCACLPLSDILSHRPATIVDILQERSARQYDEPIYIFLRGEEQESLSYGELDKRARSLAAELSAIGAVGDRALLLYPPGLDYVVALFACMYAGLVPVPTYAPRPNRPLSRFESIIMDAEPTIALTTRELLDSPRGVCRQQAGLLARMQWLSTDDLPDTEVSDSAVRHLKADAAAILQYTSGSTALPKGVVLSHDNILHNSAVIRHNFRLSSESRGVIWLPPYHDMGLIGGILQPVYSGFPVYLLSPTSFLQRPFRWLQAISRFRGTCSGSPNFAYDLCVRKISAEEKEQIDLSSWTVAFVGAEPVRKRTLDEFCASFSNCGFRRRSFHPCYGLAETTLMATGAEYGEEPECQVVSRVALEQEKVEPPRQEGDDCTLVGCGRAIHETNIRIVNPASASACEDGCIGEIWVSGPSVAQGYWRQAKETLRVFGASLSSGDGPFFRTGDLGFIKDDELYVTGRIKDLIIIDGRNHYSHDIEFTVEHSHAALRPSSTAAFSIECDGAERVIVMQELDKHEAEDLKEIAASIRRRIGEVHDIRVDEILLVRLGAIPRTTSGKIQRYLCCAAYTTGTIETLA
jgi:acyl-CoA synthetase (AMP-forming)/AMP-acid ligase II